MRMGFDGRRVYEDISLGVDLSHVDLECLKDAYLGVVALPAGKPVVVGPIGDVALRQVSPRCPSP